MATEPQKADYNPRDPGDQAWVLKEAEQLRSGNASLSALRRRERALLRSEQRSFRQILALRLARSSRLLGEQLRRDASPLHLSVVVAVYRETGRLVPPDQHPHGEDLLVRKVHELDWLLSPFPQVTWELVVVDDGCPDGSAALAREIARERCPGALIVWIDSDEASTTTALDPYLDMLKAAVRMYRAQAFSSAESDALAAFIDGLSPEDWRRLIDITPSAIADQDPRSFGRKRPLDTKDLERLLSGAEADQ